MNNVIATGIGEISNITSTYFDVSNIEVPDIQRIMSTTASDIISLNQSPNVNIYSTWSPRKWVKGSNSTISSVVRTPYDFESWGGYNHYAPSPSPITSLSDTIDFYEDEINGYTQGGSIGEINWKDIDSSAASVQLFFETPRSSFLAMDRNLGMTARTLISAFNSDPHIYYTLFKSDFQNMDIITVSLYVNNVGKVPNTSISLTVRFCSDASLSISGSGAGTFSGSSTWTQRGNTGTLDYSIDIYSVENIWDGTAFVECDVYDSAGNYKFVFYEDYYATVSGGAISLSGNADVSGNEYADGDYIYVSVSPSY